MWVLFVVEAFAAAFGGFLRPSLDSLTPRLVEKDELTAAGALDSLRFQIGLIGGPRSGGVLIATIGLPGVFGIDIATFLVSLAALGMMRAVPPPPDAERPSLRRIAEGFSYAKSRPELHRHLRRRHRGHVLRHAGGAVPGVRAGVRRPGRARAAVRGAAGRLLVATATSGWTRKVHRHGLAVIVAAGAWGWASCCSAWPRACRWRSRRWPSRARPT